MIQNNKRENKLNKIQHKRSALHKIYFKNRIRI